MVESLNVWHAQAPSRGNFERVPEGVCRCDFWNCQTLGVPRQRSEAVPQLDTLLVQPPGAYGYIEAGWPVDLLCDYLLQPPY